MGEFNYDIVRTFVAVTMYPQYNNMIRKQIFKKVIIMHVNQMYCNKY
jgi:hypothetical protein